MTHARWLLPCLALCLAACQDDASPPVAASASSQAQTAEAESTVGGTTVHVSAVQTSQLADAVARQYGIARSPTTVLLLVNLRNAGNAPAPAITATVTDLQGHTTPVALHALHVAQGDADSADYIGTVAVTLPDTLRFAVVARRGGAMATVEVTRDFYPQ